MASAKISIGQANITNGLGLDIYENTNLTAVVSRTFYAYPHPTTRNIQIDGLNPGMHTFRWYERVDNADIPGILLSTTSFDVGQVGSVDIQFIDLVVDRGNANDPSAGDTSVTISSLIGYTILSFKRGLGPRIEDTEVVWNDTTGELSLASTDETFDAGDTWHLIAVKILTQSAPVAPRGILTGLKVETGNPTINSSNLSDYENKMVSCEGASAIQKFTIYMPDIATDKVLHFSTRQFSNRYVEFEATGTSAGFLVSGAPVTKIWLGKYEDVFLKKEGDIMRVISGLEAYNSLGQEVKSINQPKNTLAMPATQSTGQWYLVADHPRIYYRYIVDIVSGNLSTYTTGNTYPDDVTKFAVDLVGTGSGARFWVPCRTASQSSTWLKV